jgi:hypothetical protein
MAASTLDCSDFTRAVQSRADEDVSAFEGVIADDAVRVANRNLAALRFQPPTIP